MKRAGCTLHVRTSRAARETGGIGCREAGAGSLRRPYTTAAPPGNAAAVALRLESHGRESAFRDRYFFFLVMTLEFSSPYTSCCTNGRISVEGSAACSSQLWDSADHSSFPSATRYRFVSRFTTWFWTV